VGHADRPRNFNRTWDARCTTGRRTYATLLGNLDVHPCEVMQILRHAQIAVTMEIYAQASSTVTGSTLKRLANSLGG
jgi:integrase